MDNSKNVVTIHWNKQLVPPY